jgi:hypothetical protein
LVEETQAGAEGASGAAASTEGTTEPSRTAESDFKERARRDPDWAWEQVRGFQSTADKAQGAEGKYNELVTKIGERGMNLINQYGGDIVAQATENYATLRGDPTVGEVVQAFERTGKISLRGGTEPNAETEDEYKTPEEKKIEALQAELAAVRQDVSAQTLTSGREAIQRNMENVFKDIPPLTPEDAQKVREHTASQFEAWGRMGPAGEQAIKSVMTPQGETTVRGIMLGAVTGDMLTRGLEYAASARRRGLGELDTEGRGGVASTGREELPVFKTAAEAALHAEANPDLHTSR